MNIQENITVQKSMNIKDEESGEPITQALGKEQSSGLGKIRTEEDVADKANQPSSEKAGDESDHDTSPSDSSSAKILESSNASLSSWAIAWDATSQAYYWWNMITNETTWENPHGELQLTAAAGSVTGNSTAGAPAASAPTVTADSNASITPAAPPVAAPVAAPVVAPTAAPAAGLASKAYPNNNSFDYHLPHTSTYRYRSDLPPQLANSTHTFYAHFNARTGKFQTAMDISRTNPERMSIETRATRQMQYYFDVDAYMEQRNWEKAMGTTSKRMKRPLTKKEIERFKKAKQEKKMKRTREWLCD